KAKKSVRLMMEKLIGMEFELMLFWSSVVAKTINGEVQLHALVDGKRIVITETSISISLRLSDAEVSKIDIEIPQSSGPMENVADEAVHKERGDSLVKAATTASSLEAEQDSGNIDKTKSKATLNKPSFSRTGSGSGPRRQETIGDTGNGYSR
ncbi:hypothetical protein Tco_0353516, partial [Tanacetum coccineum]